MGNLIECVAKEYSIKEPKLNFEDEDEDDYSNNRQSKKKIEEINVNDFDDSHVVPRVDRKRTEGTSNNYESNYLGAERGVSRSMMVKSKRKNLVLE